MTGFFPAGGASEGKGNSLLLPGDYNVPADGRYARHRNAVRPYERHILVHGLRSGHGDARSLRVNGRLLPPWANLCQPGEQRDVCGGNLRLFFTALSSSLQEDVLSSR